MKRILGLDLGTNSIGSAIIEYNSESSEGKILDLSVRVIPMDQAEMSDYESGNTVSKTADRTRYRGVRRLRERSLLRRERLHRVLNILGYLPEHYLQCINFSTNPGKFNKGSEPKLAYRINDRNNHEFIFKESFLEMVEDFKVNQPLLFKDGNSIPYDWTIYFLRKKALKEKIANEELAWLLLNFNQKRGYYQLRGDELDDDNGKNIEYHALKVVRVEADHVKRVNDDVWYNCYLENGWVYRRTSKVPLEWEGKTKEFIVTTEVDENGDLKKDKEGNVKRTFRVPKDDDWTLIKKKTELNILHSGKTVGEYIYDNILSNPNQKIKGKLVRTIERKFYKQELYSILEKQKEFRDEFTDSKIFDKCIYNLYPYNESHASHLKKKGFLHLFIEDIIFYQRPLKSKKSQIANCRMEYHKYKDKSGNEVLVPLKCISKSNPLFQEFRLWIFIKNLKIYMRESEQNGKLIYDADITSQFLNSDVKICELFQWLNKKKSISQKELLKQFGLKEDKYRWNYVEDKIYPCNETRSMILSKLDKCIDNSEVFLTPDVENHLWHLIYSINDKYELKKALEKFAQKHCLTDEFVIEFEKFPRFESEYGSYSEKAIKKLLPLMQTGNYWSKESFNKKTIDRIYKVIDGEVDSRIAERVRANCINLNQIEDFCYLPEWLASYIVYNRFTEDESNIKWQTPQDIDHFLKYEFTQHSLRNPIVEQVVTETLRVVADLLRYHGKGSCNYFEEIHIELGRDLKNPSSIRQKITKQVSENENTNLRLKALLLEMMQDESYENVRPNSPSQLEILKLYEEGALSAGIGLSDEIIKISRNGSPSKADLIKYKLWLEQKYRSPYTGAIIPLSKLFTNAYQIEHIIPQARFFDDSLSNKVICESEINHEKGKLLAFEFISKRGGEIIELSYGRKVAIFKIDEYQEFVMRNYKAANTAIKRKKLLMDDLPDSFIQRQLNDTRYISKLVRNLLSRIVREDNEKDSVSKNVITVNGVITDKLKTDWGLKSTWNEIVRPRFERLNQITNSEDYGKWIIKDGKNIFQTNVPLHIQKGYSKKRIDHRHHALDALVIASATRNHINYLNNSAAKTENKRYELRSLLSNKIYIDNESYNWILKKPWDTFTTDTLTCLQSIIVSFKQNMRIINRTVNRNLKWVNDEVEIKKKLVRQTKGDHWAIRKPLHKETVYGRVNLQLKKIVSLNEAVRNYKYIVDRKLKAYIGKKTAEGISLTELLKFFKSNDYIFEGIDIKKVEVYYFDNNYVSSRVKLDESFNSQAITSITDTGIQSILFNHLASYNEEINGKIIEHPELAFSADGIENLNESLVKLNKGKDHKPIQKVRKFEPLGNKYPVGLSAANKKKFVEAAKGTNLFYAIYQTDEQKRTYETISLNVVIERLKQGLMPVPELDEKGNALLFYLSPNDLITVEGSQTIYKVVSFTGNRLYAIPHHVANCIHNKVEFTSLNKVEKTDEGISIKEKANKLVVNRIGKIVPSKEYLMIHD